MKLNVEAILGVLLVVLLCFKPTFLTELTDTVLGKAVLLLCVLVVSHLYGRNAGVLTALIVIVLMHTKLEGVDETLEKSDDEEDEEDEEAKQEAKAASETTNNIVENEERMRPKDSNTAAPSTGEGPQTSEGPLPMPSTTTEGFALLN